MINGEGDAIAERATDKPVLIDVTCSGHFGMGQEQEIGFLGSNKVSLME